MRACTRSGATLLALAVSACSGGAPNAARLLPTGATSARHTSVRLRIVVPPRSARAHEHHRKPRYVSPSTQSLVYVISFGGAPVTNGSGYVNLTAGSPYCSGGDTQPLDCSITLRIPVGTTGAYSFALAAFDATQSGGTSSAPCTLAGTPPSIAGCSGNLLSQAVVAQTLTVGQANTVGVTLGGIPASLTVQPLSPGYLQQGGLNLLELWGPNAQKLVIDARDADGNAIVGPGAPTYTITSANTALLTVSPTSSSTPNIVALQAPTSGSPAVVTPGTVNLQIAVTPAADSGDTTALNATVPVRIAHSLLYVSEDNAINVYEDGNTSASATITDGINVPEGVAVDNAGTLYVANAGGTTGTVTEYPAGSTSYSTQITNGIDNPQAVAVDAAGTLYVANFVGGTVTEYPAGSTSPGVTITNGINLPGGVAVDAVGTLYVANAGSNTVTEYPAGSTSPSATITSGTSVPTGVAVDAAGTLYVANFVGGTVTEYPAGSTSPSVTITNGIAFPYGVAVDAAGTLYVANNTNNAVTEYPAGSTAATTPSTTLNLAYAPNYLAVVPAAVTP